MQKIAMSVRVTLITLAALGLAASCSSKNDSAKKGNDGTAGAGVSLTDPTGSTSTPGSSQADSCKPQADNSGCVGSAYEGEAVPLDILVMFDLSCSMSCDVDQSGCCLPANANATNKWRLQPVRSAMKTFLQDPSSVGIGVGLSFFGNHPLSAAQDPVVCSMAHYSEPKVEIGTLPDNATSLIDALDAGMPQGGTPTHLAIDGACDHATKWLGGHAGHKVVILLVTDGIPEASCNATIQLAEASATACYGGGQGIQTYVLGISSNNNGRGSSLTQLDRIAVAGGTSKAYLTDANNVAASVLSALNAIRADASIPCDLAIPAPPSGQTIDPGSINIGICGPGGLPAVTPYVKDAANCGGDPGWYYDDPNSPSMIHLCNVTCTTVQQMGSSLFFSVGCATQVGPTLQ